MTVMVEPVPGTQVIYEYLSSCGHVEKTYPPNTTLFVTLAVECAMLTAYGSISKLVVVENHGVLYLGNWNSFAHVEEVVIRSTDGFVAITESVGSLEIQSLTGGSVEI